MECKVFAMKSSRGTYFDGATVSRMKYQTKRTPSTILSRLRMSFILFLAEWMGDVKDATMPPMLAINIMVSGTTVSNRAIPFKT